MPSDDVDVVPTNPFVAKRRPFKDVARVVVPETFKYPLSVIFDVEAKPSDVVPVTLSVPEAMTFDMKTFPRVVVPITLKNPVSVIFEVEAKPSVVVPNTLSVPEAVMLPKKKPLPITVRADDGEDDPIPTFPVVGDMVSDSVTGLYKLRFCTAVYVAPPLALIFNL